MNTYTYDVSIVMAFHNRKEQLINTLEGFEKQYANKYNFEVIIVDDNSDDENCIKDIVHKYPFPINLIIIDANQKKDRINPCVAYNKGFKIAKGKIVIIQNPECYHVGDVIKHSLDHLTEQSYFSYSCYSPNSFEITNQLLESQNPYELIKEESFDQINSEIMGLSWYNHPIERPSFYHFCSAIHNSNLQIIGGFDKRFANGYCFDDSEFVLAVKYNLQLDMKIIDPQIAFVIHQFHSETGCLISSKNQNFAEKRAINKQLYEEIKNHHEQKDFYYPKLLHLYWDGSPMSFLNLITILSFNKHNKFWKINVYTPIEKIENMSWVTHEQKTKYTGKCYFYKLYDIPNVFIHKVDFNKIGFDNNVSEVIKSDYFRYYILQKHGGVWSDFDMFYTSSIEDKMNFKDKNNVISICVSYGNPKDKQNTISKKYFAVSFFLCSKNNKFFKEILKECDKHYDPENYQSIGSVMWDHLFKPNEINYPFDDDIQICNGDYYMPYAYNELYEILVEENNALSDNNVCVHWFNGSPISKKYVNDLDKRLSNFIPTCFLDKLIEPYVLQFSRRPLYI